MRASGRLRVTRSGLAEAGAQNSLLAHCAVLLVTQKRLNQRMR